VSRKIARTKKKRQLQEKKEMERRGKKIRRRYDTVTSKGGGMGI
jgi:hypothetical protein